MRFLFFLFPLLLWSQEQIIKGLVLDAGTKAPIPYVNISVLNSQFGTSSNENGSYALKLGQRELKKEIHVSSLGYKDTTLTVTSLLKLDTVYLSPLVEEFDEIVISNRKKRDFFEVNPIRKKDLVLGFGGFKNHPYIFALYIPHDVACANFDFIENAKVYLNKSYFLGGIKPMKSKFRFRMFSVGKDSLPDKDLITENVIITTTKKQREAEVDLSGFDLVFPDEGVFVAIEWLYIPFNTYEFTYKKGKGIKTEVTENRYAPRLSWVERKRNENRLSVYTQGKWIQMDLPGVKEDEFIIPAISLTLSD